MTYTDSEGIEWTVTEIAASSLASMPRQSLRYPEFKDGWLLFQSAGARKRLAPYPHEWRQLDAHELEQLCARARAEIMGPSGRPLAGEFPAFGNNLTARE